jgi:hypothetical protein
VHLDGVFCEAFAEEDVIVHEQDAQRRHRVLAISGSQGSRTCTRVPMPGCDLTSTLPPTPAARSRMICRP